MLLEVLRVVLVSGLLVALPGWLLVNALFAPSPSARLSGPQRLYLIVGGGILLVMLVGSILGFLPHGSRGGLQMLATGGMPNVEVAMIALCLGLFWAGARRGAYPKLSQRYPRLVAPWAQPGSSKAADQQP